MLLAACASEGCLRHVSAACRLLVARRFALAHALSSLQRPEPFGFAAGCSRSNESFLSRFSIELDLNGRSVAIPSSVRLQVREVVDDELQAARQRACAEDAGIVGNNLAVELHAK